MRCLLESYILLLIISFAVVFNPDPGNTQFPATGHILHSIRCEGQSLSVPTWQYPETGEGDIMIDNFEYWDSPYNHGWRQLEPAYPVYGFGIGHATIFRTVLDFQQGNRVLLDLRI